MDSRAYLRLRQQVGIIDAKIREGEGAHPSGGCGESYYGSLRKVGVLPAAAGPYDEDKAIYWESENYTNDDLTNFLLINTKKEEGKHYFDVYIDEREKDALETDPKYEFIRNCQETGGLIPVVEGPATPTFPPQAISLTDEDFNNQANQKFEIDGFEENFASYSAELDPYYLRVDEKDVPGEADQIGIFEKTIEAITKNI